MYKSSNHQIIESIVNRKSKIVNSFYLCAILTKHTNNEKKFMDNCLMYVVGNRLQQFKQY